MTNEELCVLIQNGKKEYIPQLWNQVQKLMYLKAKHAYTKFKDRCLQCGIELSDMEQVTYFAFLNAIKAYKADNGNKFTSYIEYPFKTAIYELVGLKTVKNNKEPLNNCKSLNEPINSSEDDTITLLDTLADDASLEFIEQMDTASVCDTVRSVIETLNEPYKDIIKHLYFEGLSLKKTGEKLGVSHERVRQLKQKALKILSKNKIMLELWKDCKDHSYRTSFSWFKNSPEYYEILNSINKTPLSYGQRQAELYKAQRIWEIQNNLLSCYLK